MSCSKMHGTQAFIGFIADSTGETISQQDWHDLRDMAEKSGAPMGREGVSAQEAIESLRALDARIKRDTVEGKKTGDSQDMDDVLQRYLSGENKIKQQFADMERRIRASTNKPASEPQPTSLPNQQPTPAFAEAENELLAARVTRGTISVIRMFAIVGVKPLLDMIRARREERRRFNKALRRTRKLVYGK